jgi:LuxR family maltose regulon positive regulatory protein
MEPMNSLILTKLRSPSPRSTTIRRDRLLQKMSLKPETDLVLVCAPAGYGKTTLLVDWKCQLNQAGIAVSWLSMDKNDNQPVIFGKYLIASL